jgi:acyl dehydratase
MDVPVSAYGQRVDPALLGNECYRALRAAGISIDGWVQTVQGFDQSRAARLGEALDVSFEVAGLRPHRRGEWLHLRFDFKDRDERHVMTADIEAIRTDIDKMGALGGGQPAETDAPVLAQKHLTPARVTDFSGYVGNEIHLDAAFAQARGFRQPVAQGLMTTGFFTGALAGAGPIGRLRMTSRYLSPVFWDDTVAIRGDRTHMMAITGDGRLAAEADITHIEQDSEQA